MENNTVKAYVCPGCGGEYIYRAGTDDMICPHCGRTTGIREVEAQGASAVRIGHAEDNAGTEAAECKCPNCGAGIPLDGTTSATFCDYCKSPLLIGSRLSGSCTPEKIVPFAFDKKKAQENFRKWTGTGKLTPMSFRSAATMDKVTGLYVPHWLYSYTVDTAVKAECYNESVTKSGDTETVTRENFDAETAVSGVYVNVPQNASARTEDDRMAVIEPFDYDALKDFAEPYLSGYYAEKYDASAAEYEAGVKKRIEEDMVSAAGDVLGEKYDHVEVKDSESAFRDASVIFALLPVWLLNFEYMGKTYPLYMNGQTGKICGQLPTSRLKVLLVFLIAFAVFFGIAFLIFGR